MNNDKNPLFSPFSRREMPPRVPIGHSCPNFARSDINMENVPRLDERQGRRLCDGTLVEDGAEDAPHNRMMPRNENAGGSCHGGCGEYEGGWGLESYPLAMVYSPLQQFRELYEPDVALMRGTMFSELDLPFEGGKMNKGGCKLC